MVHFKNRLINGEYYLAIYRGNKFIKHIGKEEDISTEKLLFLKKKYGGTNG